MGLFGKVAAMSRKFRCDVCLTIFSPEWSKEQALEEKNKNFGDLSLGQCGEVCTGCFIKIMLYAEATGQHKDPSWRKGYEDQIDEVLCQKD